MSHELVPRPRPGYQSPEPAVPLGIWVGFAAALLRSILGVVLTTMAMLFFPPSRFTPILTGAGLLLTAQGLAVCYRYARLGPRVSALVRVALIVLPVALAVMFVTRGVLGPMPFGPR